jgi:hypothetical protein
MNRTNRSGHAVSAVGLCTVPRAALKKLADRHRKLCFKYKMAQHPEGGNAARAVLFPGNRPKPEIVFVDSNRWAASAEDIVLTGLQSDDSALVTLTMLDHPISGRRLPYDMKIVVQKRDIPLNASLLFCYNDNWKHPVPRFPWAGNIVVLRLRQNSDIAEDITMSDFQDVLDFFLWYGQQFTPEMFAYCHNYDVPAAAPPIQGVVVRCAATESLYPTDGALVSVQVDHLHPIRGLYTTNAIKVGEVSPLSLQLGTALRVYSVPHPPLETGKGRWEFLEDASNNRAAELMLRLPVQDLTISQTELLNTGPEIDGDVLIVREDGEDVSVNQVAAMWLIARDCLAPPTNGLSLVEVLTSNSYSRALETQERHPVAISNLTTSGVKPVTYPEGFMELLDPGLLADAPGQALNDAAAPAPPSPDNTARPVLQHERTLPSLCTQIKGCRSRLNVHPNIVFEGYSFKLFDGDEPYKLDEDAKRTVAETDVDGQPEEMGDARVGITYHYPSPPPRRYTYSARVVSEEDVLECEAMEED